MNYLIIFLVYLLLLNAITSYRLLTDEYYEFIQKSIQLLMIWLLPLIGVIIVGLFLNQEALELRGFWKKYPKTIIWICGLFLIAVKKEKFIRGYDSEGNDMGNCYNVVNCIGRYDGSGE